MFDNSPNYISKSTSANLVDIVHNSLDSVIDKLVYNTKVSYGSVIDDLDVIKLGKPIDVAVNKTGEILAKTKNLNSPLLKATCVSVVANVGFSYLFKNNNLGYVVESLSYSLAFPCFYWLANKDSRVSNNKTRVGIDLLVLGAASFLLSVGPYRAGRNEIIDTIIQNRYIDFIKDPGSLRATAAGITQMVLMPVYMLALNPVKKGIDYLDKKFKFKSKLVESIPTPTEMINKLFYGSETSSEKTTITNDMPGVKTANTSMRSEVTPNTLPIINSVSINPTSK